MNMMRLTSESAQILASASYDDTIKLYVDDPSDDWYCASTLSGHDSTVWTLAWEPERGRYLASGADDGLIRIWRVTGTPSTEVKADCIAVIQAHDRSVLSLSWTKGQKDLLSGKDGEDSLGWLSSTGSDGSIIIWEITVRMKRFCHRVDTDVPASRNAKNL